VSGPVRPEPDESTLSDADLWEAKVAQGMPKDSATAYVRNRTRNVSFSDVRGGSSSRAAPEIDADRAAFTRGGGSSFGADPSGAGSALLAGTSRGAGYGFDDELLGAGAKLLGASPTATQDLRDFQRGAQTAHPKTFLAGEIAGAVVSPITRLISRGAPATSLGGRVLQGARIGGTGGAIAGAGTAEPGQRGTGALIGGGAGFLFGGGVPVLGKIGGTILDAVGLRPETALAVARSVGQRAGSALRARTGAVGDVAGVGGSTSALGGAPRERVVAAAMRDADGRIGRGAVHSDATESLGREPWDSEGLERGFVTSTGRFLRADDPDVLRLARENSQLHAEAQRDIARFGRRNIDSRNFTQGELGEELPRPRLANRSGNVDFGPLARGAASVFNTLGPEPMQDVTASMLLRTADKAGRTLPELIQNASAAQSAGSPLTFMEQTGEAGRRLGRAARGVSGRAATTIEERIGARHAAQQERVVGALEQGLGRQRGNIYETIDESVARQKAASGPLYEKAFGAPPIPKGASVQIDDETVSLESLLNTPSIKQALEHAKSVAAEKRTAPPVINEDGSVPVATLNSIKKSLDAMLGYGKRNGKLFDGTAADKEKLDAIDETRRALLKIADKAVPDYKAARNAFAGEAALQDAIESGREAVTKRLDPRLVAREMAKLGDSEKEMYRQGALDALQQRMDAMEPGANKVRAVATKNADKDRLRAMFPEGKAGDDAFDRFMEQMGNENEMVVTRNRATQGSQTDANLAAAQELEDEGLAAVAQTVANPKTALLQATYRTLANRARVQTRAVADALAPQLTQGATPASGSLMELLNGLTEAEKRIARRAAERRAITAASGASVGSSAAP